MRGAAAQMMTHVRKEEVCMPKLLRAGVIGAGVFGGHHAHKFASLPGVQLTAVLDPHAERAEALAGPLRAAVFEDLDAFLGAVDVVTAVVSTPARLRESRSMRPCSSSPTEPIIATLAPNSAAATAWFALLPPEEICSAEPFTVCPGSGSLSV